MDCRRRDASRLRLYRAICKFGLYTEDAKYSTKFLHLQITARIFTHPVVPSLDHPPFGKPNGGLRIIFK